VPTAVLLLVLP